MKATKKFTAMLLCIIMLFSCIQVSALGDIELMNTSISNNKCTLTISGINSTSEATMQASKSMALSIKMELQKVKSGEYTTIETWSANKTGRTLSMSETRLINLFATYRLKVTFKAGSETLVKYAYP